MNQTTTPESTRDLSPSERKLLATCQLIRFGSLFGLEVLGGQPVFDPPPRMRRNVRLNEKPLVPQPKPTSFALKDKHRLLIQMIREMNCGTIDKIEIRNGLPEVICLEGEVG